MKVKSRIRQIIQGKKPPLERFFESVKNTPKKTGIKKTLTSNQIDYKAYARFPSVWLPKPVKKHRPLQDTLFNLSSTRTFSKKKLSIRTLSTLLYYSLGIRNASEKDPNSLRRFYPSAGGKYPIEAYVLAQSVSGLHKGAYHYYVREHLLELVEDELPLNLQKYFTEEFLLDAPVVIVLTSIFVRTTVKYGIRGYNLALLEAGHVGQNIYLNSSDLQLSVCAAGGFYEDALSKLLNIETKIETPIYVFGLG